MRQQFPVQSSQPIGRVITTGQIQAYDQYSVALEAGVDIHQLLKASHKEQRTNQQDQRQRDLRDYEHSTQSQTSPTRRHATAARLQNFAQIGPRRS